MVNNTFTVSKTTLLKPLTKVLSVAGKRSTMPVLANVMVELTPDGSKITATDLETVAVLDLGMKRDDIAKFLVPADKFAGMLKELDDGDIELSVNATVLGVKQKNTSYTVTLQDIKDFPEVPSQEEGATITIKNSTLKSAIDKVDHAVSNDESRIIMNGIYLEFQAKRFISVATDGFRLACYGQYTDDETTMPYFVIPKTALSEIKNIILSGPSDEIITIHKTARKVTFATANARLACSLLDGPYPDYKTVMPRDNSLVASVDKEALLKSVKKVGTILVTRADSPLKVRFTAKAMEISAESDLGKSGDTVDATYTGLEVEYYFNSKYLLDTLVKIPDGRIIIDVPGSHGAVLFKGENVTNYFNIIMPMRI